MALEPLSLPPALVEGDAAAVTNVVGEDGSKAPRLPRWTRQEILVLIQGKKVAENRVRRGRTAGLALGSSQAEPKWASVSLYCKRHGVNRGPVQCRKRWSNLAGDYKKIKEWESQTREEADSFWVMRNDLRRERKLPGFFDREVYDILDGGGGGVEMGLVLSLAPATEEDRKQSVVAEATEAVFDSGRSAAAEDGLFSDEEAPEKGAAAKEIRSTITTSISAPMPISEKQYQPYVRGNSDEGTTNVNPAALNPQVGSACKEEEEEGRKRKRKRFATDEDIGNEVIEVMERNGRILNAQLEAHNNNLELDREDRKQHAGTLLSVLNKLAGALGRIADKL